jgi:hypothetical protein
VNDEVAGARRSPPTCAALHYVGAEGSVRDVEGPAELGVIPVDVEGYAPKPAGRPVQEREFVFAGPRRGGAGRALLPSCQ